MINDIFLILAESSSSAVPSLVPLPVVFVSILEPALTTVYVSVLMTLFFKIYSLTTDTPSENQRVSMRNMDYRVLTIIITVAQSRDIASSTLIFGGFPSR